MYLVEWFESFVATNVYLKFGGGIAITILSFLFGNNYMPYVALFVLMFLDIFSKFYEVTRPQGATPNRSFWNFICSRVMREGFYRKFKAYMTICIAAAVLIHLVPNVSFWGVQWNEVPITFACAVLGVAEVISILENLIAGGATMLKPLHNWFKKKEKELGGEDK